MQNQLHQQRRRPLFAFSGVSPADYRTTVTAGAFITTQTSFRQYELQDDRPPWSGGSEAGLKQLIVCSLARRWARSFNCLYKNNPTSARLKLEHIGLGYHGSSNFYWLISRFKTSTAFSLWQINLSLVKQSDSKLSLLRSRFDQMLPGSCVMTL